MPEGLVRSSTTPKASDPVMGMIQAASMVRVNVGAADCGHSDANQDFIGFHIANPVLSKLQWRIRRIANSRKTEFRHL